MPNQPQIQPNQQLQARQREPIQPEKQTSSYDSLRHEQAFKGIKIRQPKTYLEYVELFKNCIVEVVVIKPEGPSALICTSDFRFVMSELGRKIFNPKNVRKATNEPAISLNQRKQQGLIVVWDLLEGTFKTIPMTKMRIVGIAPLNTLSNAADVLAYFKEKLNPELRANPGKVESYKTTRKTTN